MIKDRILKSEPIDWQNIKTLQPDNFKIPEQQEVLKKSIVGNGFVSPFCVWEDAEGVIWSIDGVHRIKALTELQEQGEDIPKILTANFIDAKTRKEAGIILLEVFNTKQNKATEDGLELLKIDLNISVDDLHVDVADLDLKLDEILEAEILPLEEADEEAPTPPVTPKTVKGDLYELNGHRVLCGDSTMIDDVDKLMQGEKADMVFTDPPYNVGYKGTMSHTSKNGKQISHITACSQHDSIRNDSKTKEDFKSFINDVVNNIKLICKGSWYISFSSQTLEDLLIPLRNHEMNWKSIIIWMKNQSTISSKDYKSRYEPLVYGDFGKTFVGQKYHEEDIWEIQKTLKNDLHPTMKPINLIVKAINNSSKKENLIADLFLGSGSTLIACEQTNRKCYGLELEERYCDVVVTRWVNMMEQNKKEYSVKLNGEKIDWKDLH